MADVRTENTVKRLENDLKKASNPALKEEIKRKIATLKGNKEITK